MSLFNSREFRGVQIHSNNSAVDVHECGIVYFGRVLSYNSVTHAYTIDCFTGPFSGRQRIVDEDQVHTMGH